MALGEIASDALGGALRFLGRMFTEVVVEIAVKGLGYQICKRVDNRSTIDSVPSLVVGMIAWTSIGIGLYCVYVGNIQ